ncbi:ABC-three component system protein [Singulisphaera sp. Ch08]|uniref:ABC-three component system protein n=1 Tax=Singulisphaera sp. Ch08 TaxID=3120278 RepID=A0AAU7CLL1_9BACT
MAPFDLGPDLSTLLETPADLNALLIAEWEKPTKAGVAAKLVPLDAGLRAYIEGFDFSIVSFKPQREIIEEITETEFYKRTFGCGGLVRPPLDPIPDAPAPEELNYVQALRVAFAEFLGMQHADTTDEIIGGNPALKIFYKISRECFYKAEQLYRFGRDTFPTSHCFEDLQDQVYTGILAAASARYDHGYAKALAVTSEAGKLQLGNHFLVGLKLVEVRDCHGICHQIVNSNDGRLSWSVKTQEPANG